MFLLWVAMFSLLQIRKRIALYPPQHLDLYLSFFEFNHIAYFRLSPLIQSLRRGIIYPFSLLFLFLPLCLSPGTGSFAQSLHFVLLQLLVLIIWSYLDFHQFGLQTLLCALLLYPNRDGHAFGDSDLPHICLSFRHRSIPQVWNTQEYLSITVELFY